MPRSNIARARTGIQPPERLVTESKRLGCTLPGEPKRYGRVQDDVMTQLKRHLASAEQIDVSRYQFVNIDRVREAAGPRWAGLRDRVFIASRSIIERRVADDDLVIQCATGYLVIFKALSGSKAQTLTDQVRAELETFFLGQHKNLNIQVSATSEQLSVEEFTATLASADVEEPRQRQPKSLATRISKDVSSLRYEPVWDQEREAVASFFVRPHRTETDRAVQSQPVDLTLEEMNHHARVSVDQAILNAAADDLETLIDSGTRCALIVPAGFKALSNPRTRSQYVTALASLPRHIRQLIWIQIQDAPADPPQLLLEETARILLVQTGKLFAQTSTQWRHWHQYEGIGLSAIGARFPHHFSDADRTNVDRMLASANRAQTMVYLDGVHTWEQARAATRTGARLFAGRAIGHLEKPSAPFRLTRARLLAGAA